MANNDAEIQQITDIINKVKEQITNANKTIKDQDKKITDASKKIQKLLKELYDLDVSLQGSTPKIMSMQGEYASDVFIDDLHSYLVEIQNNLATILGNLQKN